LCIAGDAECRMGDPQTAASRVDAVTGFGTGSDIVGSGCREGGSPAKPLRLVFGPAATGGPGQTSEDPADGTGGIARPLPSPSTVEAPETREKDAARF
jgi:hypothetical protein